MMKVVKKKVVTPVIIVCWCWYLHSFFKQQFLTPGPINLLAKKKMLEPTAKASECVTPSLSEISHLLFFWSVSNVKNTVSIFHGFFGFTWGVLKMKGSQDPQNHLLGELQAYPIACTVAMVPNFSCSDLPKLSERPQDTCGGCQKMMYTIWLFNIAMENHHF